MAVYTHVPAESLAEFLTRYDAGALVSAKGIAEGVENTNYLVDTTTGRFILTLYERRVAADDLPFFLALLDHLAAKGLPVPPALRDRSGVSIQQLEGRPACLIRFLPGVSVTRPTPAAAHAAGRALRELHAGLRDFDRVRPNTMGIGAWGELLTRCGPAIDTIRPGLHAEVAGALAQVERRWPSLPAQAIHADLFPDNVLMLGGRVTGLIDFYFACTDMPAYDLAVMHSAWAFDPAGAPLDPAVGAALLAGYGLLSPAERTALPVLAQGACLRFTLTRAWDWLNTPADALVTRKDPLAYWRRFEAYRTGSMPIS